jgi:hypothetical protein
MVPSLNPLREQGISGKAGLQSGPAPLHHPAPPELGQGGSLDLPGEGR